jgi:RimJ/RimL family protein N-acetyltransferase
VLTADVDPRNAASIKLLERCGFIETHRAAGTWQVGDELCDSVYFRLKL